MLFDQLLAGLRASDGSNLFSRVSMWYFVTSTLFIGLITLVIDYTYILYMRYKLVSCYPRNL